MKLLFSLIVVVFTNSLEFSQARSSLAGNCDTVPELNKKIVAFVKANLNKKVGQGECWDLAAQALNSSGAKWDGNYGFGRELNQKADCVLPGDILQFEGVVIEYSEKNKFFRETFLHHTAVVYLSKNKKEFIVAEQNTSKLGKKVGLNPLNLENIKKGELTIYRPMK